MNQPKNLLYLIITGIFLLTACGGNPPAAPEVVKFTDMYEAGIAWMDHLKTCEPYAQSFTHPFLQVEQVNTIKGMDGDACVMSMQTTGKFTIDCKLNAEGIQALTSDVLYEQTKSKTMSIDDASTTILNSQCQMIALTTPEPLPQP